MTVGVNQPADFAGFAFNPLLGADDDAKRLAEVFAVASGVTVAESDSMSDATGDDVRAESVLQNIRDLARRAKPDEFVCLGLSGHGLRFSGGGGAFVAKDRGITSSDLRAALNLFKPGVTVLTVVDACHAEEIGSHRDIVYVEPQPRLFHRFADPEATSRDPETPDSSSQITMFACAADQSAAEASNHGRRGGVFTDALDGAWREFAVARTSWQSWFDTAYRLVPRTQDPRLRYSGPDWGELLAAPFC